MKEIEYFIKNYIGIENKDLSSIANLFSTTTLSKNDYLLKRKQRARHMHFVKTGYIRVYSYGSTGEKEVTQWISNKGMFITDLSSFMFDTPSRWNIQALSNCELYTITKERFNSIGDYIDNWHELEKLFIAKCFVSLENRVFEQLSMSAEEKVKSLLDSNSDIFLQVPLQYIASMLGMTPETLSRIRKKMIS